MTDKPINNILVELESNANPLLHKLNSSFDFSEPAFVDKIKTEMRKHEQLKYPNPPYTYKTTPITTNQGTMIATHVHYDGTPPTDGQLAMMRSHAMVLRKLSILGGVINALHFSKSYLTSDPRQRAILEGKLKEFYVNAKVLSDLSEKDEIDHFVRQLNSSIADCTGNSEDETIRQIRNAERYFVADYNRHHLLVNETVCAGKTIVQMDMPYNNTITEHQKKDFLKIHNPDANDRPLWFNHLPAWERDWLLHQIPKKLDGDWNHFLSIFKSSAMTHIPGISNARTNYFLQKDEQGNYQILSHSFKLGTMVPYEMPKKERQRETEQSAEQALDYLAKDARTTFSNAWKGVTFPPGIKPMVFVSGLLSDTLGGGNDANLMLEQKRAIKQFSASKRFADIEIITGNDPVNFLRYIAAQSGLISKLVGRWDHTRKLMDSGLKIRWFLEKKMQDGSLTSEQMERVKLMREAHTQLYHLHRQYHLPRVDRNFAAFKTAYSDILLEAMGGVVSTNCKSGKDRTGLDEIYRHAMLVYFQLYKKLPSYNESAAEHQKFIDIFVPIFNSMKIQEAASSNTPGSFGIKDNALMLCRDIAEALGPSYKHSNLCADMNKPDIYLKDEAKEAKDRAKASFRKPSIIRVGVNEKITDELLNDLATKRTHILNLMSELDSYINAKSPGSKESAKSLYRELDHLNKKVQQIEATVDTQTASLKTSINDLSTKYNKAIDTYSRSRVSRFFTLIQGKSSRYDAVLDNAPRAPKNEGLIDILARKVVRKLI